MPSKPRRAFCRPQRSVSPVSCFRTAVLANLWWTLARRAIWFDGTCARRLRGLCGAEILNGTFDSRSFVLKCCCACCVVLCLFRVLCVHVVCVRVCVSLCVFRLAASWLRRAEWFEKAPSGTSAVRADERTSGGEQGWSWKKERKEARMCKVVNRKRKRKRASGSMERRRKSRRDVRKGRKAIPERRAW